MKENNVSLSKNGQVEETTSKKGINQTSKMLLVILIIIVTMFTLFFLITKWIIPEQQYKKIVGLIDSRHYQDAYAIIDDLAEKGLTIKKKHEIADMLIVKGEYDKAYEIYSAVGDNNAILQNKYDRAIQKIEQKDYKTAYSILKDLNYKDSESLKSKIQYQAADVGSVITFGSYEQDNNSENGEEEIEWIVLSKVGTKLLVISKCGLIRSRYNEKYGDVTWETSYIRERLNKSFFNDAFNSFEKNAIISSKVTADINESFKNINPGNDTIDKIFLLSIPEIEKYKDIYFCWERALPTLSSKPKDQTDWKDCIWWTRTPGAYQSYVTLIDEFGAIGNVGDQADKAAYVRPTMWIDYSTLT